MDDVKVKVLQKALRLLDCFDRDHVEVGVSELSNLTGIPKSTVFNILSTFEMCGYLNRTKSGRYCLSNKILKLSTVFYHSNDLRSLTKPIMQSLSDRFDLTMYLGIPYENRVLYLEGTFPSAIPYSDITTGRQEPLYSTGIGKALLAYLGEDALQRLENEKLLAFTEYTITDIDELRREMERTRQRGYAIDNMENHLGIKCVAVPLFHSTGELAGAMSMSGSNLRLTDEFISELGSILIRESRQIKDMYC